MATPHEPAGLRPVDAFLKRCFDLAAALAALLLAGWLIVLAALVAAIETRSSGFFVQTRIGRHGRPFRVIKIRTMRTAGGSTVTVRGDARITRSGRLFRRLKIDELPQFINVLLGQMSLVGPRPDVPGFADRLQGEDRIVLGIRPGITGPATLHYRDEEELLARQADPEAYNREVIWPHKVEINKRYIREYSLGKDIHYVFRTVFG